jgi:hypothetical protein
MGSGKSAIRTIEISITRQSGGESYWTYENCKDVVMTIPKNLSYPIMYTPGAKYQQNMYYYNYFTSEIGE